MHRYTSKVIIRSDAVKSNGKAALALQVFINKRRKVIPLGVDVEVNYFDRVSESVKIRGERDRSKMINGIIHRAKAKAEDIFFKAIAFDAPLSRESFSEKFQKEASNQDFVEWIEEQIEAAKVERAIGTIKQYNKLLNRLREFGKEIQFTDLDYNMIEAWDRFLRKKRYEPNTVWGYHKNFKKFINLAIKKKKLIDNPYINFPLSKARTEPVFLTYAELDKLIKLYELKNLNIELQRILRYFLFMCVTGLRISDTRELSDDNLVGDYVVFRPVKTRNSRMVQKNPLSNFAKGLIRDAAGEDKHKLFRCITDQKTNYYLKEIAHHAGINKAITTKVGRHTFATIFLESGGKVEVLQRLLGHSKIETTMVYVHISKQQERSQMKNFDQFMDVNLMSKPVD